MKSTRGFMICLLLLSSCTNSDPAPSKEAAWSNDGCAGFERVTVKFQTPLPGKLRVVWRGEELINECTNLKKIRLERIDKSVRLEYGGFGYRVWPDFSLQVYDQQDCNGPETQTFSVSNYNGTTVPTSDNQCSSMETEFNP